MPRTRSRISFSAALASSWASATIARPASVVVMLELVPRRAQVGGEGDEALLGAVVEIALDAPALRLRAVDGGRAARLQPGDLGGVGLSRRWPEQGALASASSVRATPMVTHGATSSEPDDADEAASQAAGPECSSKK